MRFISCALSLWLMGLPSCLSELPKNMSMANKIQVESQHEKITKKRRMKKIQKSKANDDYYYYDNEDSNNEDHSHDDEEDHHHNDEEDHDHEDEDHAHNEDGDHLDDYYYYDDYEYYDDYYYDYEYEYEYYDDYYDDYYNTAPSPSVTTPTYYNYDDEYYMNGSSKAKSAKSAKIQRHEHEQQDEEGYYNDDQYYDDQYYDDQYYVSKKEKKTGKKGSKDRAGSKTKYKKTKNWYYSSVEPSFQPSTPSPSIRFSSNPSNEPTLTPNSGVGDLFPRLSPTPSVSPSIMPSKSLSAIPSPVPSSQPQTVIQFDLRSVPTTSMTTSSIQQTSGTITTLPLNDIVYKTNGRLGPHDQGLKMSKTRSDDRRRR